MERPKFNEVKFKSERQTKFVENKTSKREKQKRFVEFQIECIEAAFDVSMKMKIEDEKPNPIVYLSLDEMFKVLKDEGKKSVQLSKQQPKRFSVHASADPSKICFD